MTICWQLVWPGLIVIRFDGVNYFDYSRNMDSSSAINALSALAQSSRLDVFRLLVKASDKGMAAGDIANKVKVLPNTLSAHLNILGNAGLVTSSREGRSIIYKVSCERMSTLIAFLLEDCCNGSPEICAPAAACCKPSRKGKKP